MSLEQVLSGTAPAALVVLQHGLAAAPWAVVRDMLSRARGPVLGISLLHAPSVLGVSGAQAMDLRGAVPGLGSEDACARIFETISKGELRPGTTVVLDAADVLAEDTSRAETFRVLRAILSAVGGTNDGGRLILTLPTTSGFTADVLSASLSPSLAQLTLLPARAAAAVAETYLVPPDDERFPSLLETAAARGAGDKGVYDGSGNAAGPLAVLVLLRKATGGAKGIVRSLEGYRPADGPGDAAGAVVPITDVVPRPAAPAAAADPQRTTHADLNLPFNLSLTDAQRAARGAVPLPYAHEGEGADLSMGMDWSDDEEDEEI